MKIKQLKHELKNIPLVEPPETLIHRVRQTIGQLENQPIPEQVWWKQSRIFLTGAATCFLIGFLSLFFYPAPVESPHFSYNQLTTKQSRVFDLSSCQSDIFEISGLETVQIPSVLSTDTNELINPN